MKNLDLLNRYGLFDAKVPRYTSYPPANQFKNDIGQALQAQWLEAVEEQSQLSIYIHIPFCKRLCWFCACRTQGTQTLKPVDAYVEILKTELKRVREILPRQVKMNRLHMGGGTPTILSPETMQALLEQVFGDFDRAKGFEFSVEIDPTEASDRLLDTLMSFGMNRASIGVQDFAPQVQAAIGRMQSIAQTRHVVDFLRSRGIPSLNLDMLYGLPHQNQQTFAKTLQNVLELAPDRLALYGYAHVPWMSKRQVLINEEDLPTPMARFNLTNQAQDLFETAGYRKIGIDHFALPSDSLARAAQKRQLRRNFQGYTDDTCETLIGFGASSISRFKQGFVQNSVLTPAYQTRIDESGFAGQKGFEMSQDDVLTARLIEDLMCNFTLNQAELIKDFPTRTDFIQSAIANLISSFPDAVLHTNEGLAVPPQAQPLVRIIANEIDSFHVTKTAFSTAI